MPGMHMPFSTIVVPLDLEPGSERAIDVARQLSDRSSAEVQLVTVASPGLPDAPDLASLQHLVRKHGLRKHASVVLHDNDPAAAIAQYLWTIERPLVVMVSGARNPLWELLASSSCADLLWATPTPVLVVGPNVPAGWTLGEPHLVVAVEPGEGPVAATDYAGRWTASFGGTSTVAEVVASSIDSEEQHAAAVAERLAEGGAALPSSRTLLASDPVSALLQLAETTHGVVMVSSERWAHPSRTHLHSVARCLAHESSNPVLVVPVRAAPIS